MPTWQCREPAALSHVLANLEELVVKEVHGRRLRHAYRPLRQSRGAGPFSRAAQGAAGQLHRPADPPSPPARPSSTPVSPPATSICAPFSRGRSCAWYRAA
ncbi:hypothetical protein MF133_22730 [Aeromonas caviae]|nr:hypothetical protein [Aeromonas caviae]ULH02872.1 hypothetical protein MF133_22730 [Aeromonas caviae]